MALIKCSKCNHEISDTIKKCIHCGAKVNKVSKTVEKIETPPKEMKITNIVKEVPPLKPIKTRKKIVVKPSKALVFSLVIILIVIGGIISINKTGILKNFSIKDIFTMDSKNNNEEIFDVSLSNLTNTLYPTIENKSGILNNNEVFIDINLDEPQKAIYEFDIVNNGTLKATIEGLIPDMKCNENRGTICNELVILKWKNTEEIITYPSTIEPNTVKTVILEINGYPTENEIKNSRIALGLQLYAQ